MTYEPRDRRLYEKPKWEGRMAFSEQVKLKVKYQAHFVCIFCEGPFPEIHHIEPQAEGGSDDIDNAAPLCGSCHNLYGANQGLRKGIRE